MEINQYVVVDMFASNDDEIQGKSSMCSKSDSSASQLGFLKSSRPVFGLSALDFGKGSASLHLN